MTALSHLDPNFCNVAGLQAINEPLMNATKTPGLGECTSTYAFYSHELFKNFNEYGT
jgi:hypothetical protein